jgi:hypothetical protein
MRPSRARPRPSRVGSNRGDRGATPGLRLSEVSTVGRLCARPSGRAGATVTNRTPCTARYGSTQASSSVWCSRPASAVIMR